MKKRFQTLFLFVLTSLVVQFGFAQTLPEVPSTIRFADLNVRIDNGARRIIQQDIASLIQSNRKYWEAKLDRVVLYFPLIETILQDEQVPTDFKYLAVQESSLTPDAVSSSTAVGYWQFKKETATDHGLRVDDEVDERKSIVAATRGAAKYLKRNNTVYNNWVSSLYSYYLGTGGISKLVPPDWVNAQEITLTDRTDRYILRFFAHKIALETALPAYRTANTVALVEYPLGSGKRVAQIADELKVDELEVRKYNRWILGDQIPSDKDYVLAVPVAPDQVATLRQRFRTVSQTRPAEIAQADATRRNDTGYPILRKVNYTRGKPDVVLYEINGLPGIQALKGDNAATLARKARISMASFLRYNDMSDNDPVMEGEVYYLAKKMRKAAVARHNVREGETNRSISQMYGLRLKKLLRYNRLDRNQRLQVGRVMWLREKRPRNQPVEIIRTPAPSRSSQPTIAQNDTDAGDTRVGATAPTGRPAGTIPKNASERKMYSPKLVETTPSSSAPAPEKPAPADSRVAAGAPPAGRPAEVPATTQPSVSSSTGSNTQRVVIVRPEGQPAPDYAATTPAPAKPSQPTVVRPEEVKPAPVQQPLEEETADPAPTTTTRRTVVVTPAEKPAEPTRTTAPRPETTRPAPAKSTADRSLMHKVEAGQTYYSISRLYSVTVDELLAWNNLSQNDRLSVGQSLLIRGAEAEVARNTAKTGSAGSGTASSSGALVGEEIVYHTVQKGENIFRISKQYGVTIEQIRNWNQLNEDGVKVGQQLKIIKK
ncbi:LysM peptidoglycan-binding domain-containing protein [Larkinella soli]|uniref:LysM peptidoglycan-binding domain-containing protein n=1 Tax=Larkinella soli TaxID=1770527 RepID=UPI000FFBD150|nr:lytic transglycosylase domain-containing protein [Larkinella soli]